MRRHRAIVFVGFVIGLTVSTAAQQQKSPTATPQGGVVAAFYQAVGAGDIEALKRCVTAEAAKDLDGSQGTAILRAFPTMSGAVKVTQVKVNKNEATVDVEYWFSSVPDRPRRDEPPRFDPGSVATARGTGISDAYGPVPGTSLLYPPTPLQQQQAWDQFLFATRQTRVTPYPSPGAGAPLFVDHFRLILVGTEWRIQEVERKRK